jgi:hypothetical protein
MALLQPSKAGISIQHHPATTQSISTQHKSCQLMLVLILWVCHRFPLLPETKLVSCDNTHCQNSTYSCSSANAAPCALMSSFGGSGCWHAHGFACVWVDVSRVAHAPGVHHLIVLVLQQVAAAGTAAGVAETEGDVTGHAAAVADCSPTASIDN